MLAKIFAPTPIPFRLLNPAGEPLAVDPATVIVKGYGPGGGPVSNPAGSDGSITVMDPGVYQYIAAAGELNFVGGWLYLFEAPGAKTTEISVDVTP